MGGILARNKLGRIWKETVLTYEIENPKHMLKALKLRRRAWDNIVFAELTTSP
jgi:hypothetical protein